MANAGLAARGRTADPVSERTSVSIDLETAPVPFKSHRGRNVLVALAAVGLVAAGGYVAFTKLRPAPVAAAAPPIVAAPTMVAAAAVLPPPPVVEPKPVLTDTPKDALVKADQDRAKKAKDAKDAKDARTKKAKPAPKSKPPFTRAATSTIR